VLDTLPTLEKRGYRKARSTSLWLLLTLSSLFLNIVFATGGLIWLQNQSNSAEGILTSTYAELLHSHITNRSTSERNRAVTFEADPGYDVPPRQPESLWEGLAPGMKIVLPLVTQPAKCRS
jgi:hypothetical protein